MASLSQPLLLASQHPSHHQLSRRRRRRLVPPGWTFWALTAGLAATIALSAFLLVVTYTHKTFGGRFHDTIITGRATVQIFVQVISHLLSLIQVFALLWLFKLYTIEWIRRGPVALDCLKWWNSVSTLQLDRSLPWHFLLSLIILISLSFVPGAFWAGAITPIVTTETIKGNFSIPYYGLDPQSLFWNQSIGASTSNVTRLSSGSFSYSPVRTILGSMLDSAAAATAPTANNQTHRKLDNTGYTFQGRSFGVGASVGLAEPLQHTGLQSYTFVESGLMANITCWYNRTMDFHVSQPPAYSDGYPLFWYGCGVISSGGFECIRVPGDGDSEVVVMGGDPYEGHSQWAIATGRTAIKYSAINQTSCEVYFNKQGFSIMVDRATHFITVTPLQNTSEQFDPSMESLSLAARMLQFNVVQQIGMVVQTSASLLFTPLGSALMSNIANTRAAQSNGFTPTNLTETDINLLGISTALEAMVDATLVGFASAQFVIDPNGTQPTSMNATFAAIKFGDKRFIVLTSVINSVVVLFFVLFGVSCNRGWGEGSTAFDYSDLKSLIIGISMRGDENAELVKRKLQEEGKTWTADSADVNMGKLEVLLESKNGAVALILSEDWTKKQELVELQTLDTGS